MNDKAQKIKIIKSLLSQRIKDIYQEQLEHKLDHISYNLLERSLIITMEGTITPPEKLLKDNNRLHLAKQVREVIDSIIQPQIQDTIEEILNVKVVDFLSDTTLDNDMTGAIAIFELKPNDVLDNYKA